MDRWLTRLNPRLRTSSRCPAWGLAPKINDVLRWVMKLLNQRSIFVYLSKVEWTWRHIIFFHHHNKITYFIIKLVFYRQIAEKKVLSTISYKYVRKKKIEFQAISSFCGIELTTYVLENYCYFEWYHEYKTYVMGSETMLK